MKAAVTCFLLALVASLQIARSAEPDPSVSGSHSHMFKYVLEFHPKSDKVAAHFKATLTNTTSKDLQVMVNDNAFHSTLEITSKSEKKVEAFIKSYRILRLTSTWIEPTITIRSKKSISWKVPLSSLLTLHGKPVTHEFLADRQVISEMVMAVMPKTGNFISNNAVQRSKPITIPPKG